MTLLYTAVPPITKCRGAKENHTPFQIVSLYRMMDQTPKQPLDTLQVFENRPEKVKRRRGFFYILGLKSTSDNRSPGHRAILVALHQRFYEITRT